MLLDLPGRNMHGQALLEEACLEIWPGWEALSTTLSKYDPAHGGGEMQGYCPAGLLLLLNVNCFLRLTF